MDAKWAPPAVVWKVASAVGKRADLKAGGWDFSRASTMVAMMVCVMVGNSVSLQAVMSGALTADEKGEMKVALTVGPWGGRSDKNTSIRHVH